MGKESPIACQLSAMDHEQRERRRIIGQQLRPLVQDVQELPDGYAFRFPPEACTGVAEFVSLERRCCPFLRFEIEVEAEGGPLWLRMTGREGVKAFLGDAFHVSQTGAAGLPERAGEFG